MSDVIHMVDKSGCASHASVEKTLQDALDMVGKSGAFEHGKKILILCLDDTSDEYNVGFLQAGMKMSECNNLCDVAKAIFKSEMGY